VPEGSRAADAQRNQFLRPKMTPDALARAERVAALARAAGHAPAVLALAWVLSHPQVASAIVGATRVEQLAENLKAADVDLAPGLLAELDRAAPPG
jgi:aryl-alcohol dehydrogenase-like predicted oxidoreductase